MRTLCTFLLFVAVLGTAAAQTPTTPTPSAPATQATTPEKAPGKPATTPATPDKTGKPAPTVLPSTGLEQLLKALGIDDDPTPEELEEFFQGVWLQIGQIYHDTKAMKDWGQWPKRYAGKLKKMSDVEDAIKEMAASLGDPYTEYVTSKEIAAAVKQHVAGIQHLGLSLKKQPDGSFKIDYIAYGSAAYSSALRWGDTVNSIGGKELAKMKQSEADALLVAKGGTTVEVVFTHDKKEEKVNLKYAAVAPERLVFATKGKIGYVRLPSFDSESQIMGLVLGLVRMQAAKKGELEGLILDLRGNPGGHFGAAIQTASLFMEEGTIVSSKTRVGRVVTREVWDVVPPMDHLFHNAPEDLGKYVKSLFKVPMVVLIDKSTASAAEIVTAALQEGNRATVIGREASYGKGVGYSQDVLPTGGVLKITSLDYLTPKGVNLSKRGVTPDILVDQPRDSTKDVVLEAAEKHLTKKK